MVILTVQLHLIYGFMNMFMIRNVEIFVYCSETCTNIFPIPSELEAGERNAAKNQNQYLVLYKSSVIR